jgi:hypothetical protein
LKEQVSYNCGQNNKYLKMIKGQIQVLLENMLSILIYILDNMTFEMGNRRDKI